ncbi:titin-like [Stegastes partitus]|uniref:Titin-like n=1 Tax=Stegastes partitus TaxID=144197 RepID=A0A9Y4KA45_9TELE|nr:PREDICTED: titin-like [Stegastes partitus]
MSGEAEETEYEDVGKAIEYESTQTCEPQEGMFRTVQEPDGDISVTDGLKTQGLPTRQAHLEAVMTETKSKSRKAAAVLEKLTERKSQVEENVQKETEQHKVSQSSEVKNESSESSAEAASHQKQETFEADAKIQRLKDKPESSVRKTELPSKPLGKVCLPKKSEESDVEEKLVEAANITIQSVQSKAATVKDPKTTPTEELNKTENVSKSDEIMNRFTEQDAAIKLKVRNANETMKGLQLSSPEMEENMSELDDVRFEQAEVETSVPPETDATKVTDGTSSDKVPLEEKGRGQIQDQSEIIIRDSKSTTERQGDSSSVEPAKDLSLAQAASKFHPKIKTQVRDFAGSKHHMAESISAKEGDQGSEEPQRLVKAEEALVESVQNKTTVKDRCSKAKLTEEMELTLKPSQDIDVVEIKPEEVSEEPAEKEAAFSPEEVPESEASPLKNEGGQMLRKWDKAADETAPDAWTDLKKPTTQQEASDTPVTIKARQKGTAISATGKQRTTEATGDATKKESPEPERTVVEEDQLKGNTVTDQTFKVFTLQETTATRQQMERTASATPIVEETSEEVNTDPDTLPETRNTKTKNVISIEDWIQKSQEQQIKRKVVVGKTRKEGMAKTESRSLKEATPKTGDVTDEPQSAVVLVKDRGNQTRLAEGGQQVHKTGPEEAVRDDASQPVSHKKSEKDKTSKSGNSKKVTEEERRDPAATDLHTSVRPLRATAMKQKQVETQTSVVSAERPTTKQTIKTAGRAQSTAFDDVVKEKAEGNMLNLETDESNRVAPREKKRLERQEHLKVTQLQRKHSGEDKETGDTRQPEPIPTKTEETEKVAGEAEEKNQTPRPTETKMMAEMKVTEKKPGDLCHTTDFKHIPHETKEQSEQVPQKKEATEEHPKSDQMSDIILEDVVTKKSRSLEAEGQRLDKNRNLCLEEVQSKTDIVRDECRSFTVFETKLSQATKASVAPVTEAASEKHLITPLRDLKPGTPQRFIVLDKLEKHLASEKETVNELQRQESTKASVDTVAGDQEFKQLKEVTSQLKTGRTALDEGKIPSKQETKATRGTLLRGDTTQGHEEGQYKGEETGEGFQSAVDVVKDVCPPVDTKQQQASRTPVVDAAHEKPLVAKEQDTLAAALQTCSSSDDGVKVTRSVEREGYESNDTSYAAKTKEVPQNTCGKRSRMAEVVGTIPIKFPELTESSAPGEEIPSQMVACKPDTGTGSTVKGEHAEMAFKGSRLSDIVTTRMEPKACKEGSKDEPNTEQSVNRAEVVFESQESKDGFDVRLWREPAVREPSVTDHTIGGRPQSDDRFTLQPTRSREAPGCRSVVETRGLTPEGTEHAFLQEACRGTEEELCH